MGETAVLNCVKDYSQTDELQESLQYQCLLRLHGVSATP